MHILRTFGLCSVLSMALLSGQANADRAGHEAQAERFLELVNADRLAVPVYAQVQQMFAQRFEQTQAPESKRALLEQYQSKADAALDKAIGWEKVKPDLITLYTETFTEQELNANAMLCGLSQNTCPRSSSSDNGSARHCFRLPRTHIHPKILQILLRCDVLRALNELGR